MRKLASVAVVMVWAASAGAATWIEQSSTPSIRIGPFLDEDDGKTVEDSLTISQADVRLSKNNGDFAQKNESTACTHDEAGWYYCPLDATDTGTTGSLIVAIHESGSLPVWREFMIVKANTYDSVVDGTDYLQTDATQVEGGDATDSINAQVVDALDTDTYAEPSQGDPAATLSLADKISFLYKAWRNKKTQTASEFAVFNDDASTVDHKASVSDNGTTTTVGEMATGP